MLVLKILLCINYTLGLGLIISFYIKDETWQTIVNSSPVLKKFNEKQLTRIRHITCILCLIPFLCLVIYILHFLKILK